MEMNNNRESFSGNEARVRTVVELGGFYTESSEKQEKKTFRNSLSARQMKSLVALCDTLLPSINDRNVVASSDESVNKFYRTSASMVGTHEHLGVLLSEKLEHPSTWLFMISLWLLSTWFGTLILCGAACLSTKLPFFHSYPHLSPEKREKKNIAGLVSKLLSSP
ncbi:unnamed protein product [Lathyrus sativus]|nr:unnamed protein product [Lathyrus sativus]